MKNDTKRIFICSGRCLFSQGVEAFLLSDPDLSVVGWETEPEEAIRRINEVRPDAILLIMEPPFDSWLDDGPIFTREDAEVNVIALRPQEDIVRVFRGEQHVVREMTDLVEVIKQSATIPP